MNSQWRKKFDFLVDAIDKIETTFELLQVQRLIDDFVATYNPKEIYKIFLDVKIKNCEKRLI